jgi:hypothetical protein
MTAIASLADQCCIKLGIGERMPREDLNLADNVAVGLLGLEPDSLEHLLENFAEIYEQNKSYFN